MTEEKNKNNEKGNLPQGKKPKFNIYWVYGLIAIFFIALQFIGTGSDPQDITWNRFERDMLRTHDVEKLVVINRELVEIYIKASNIDNPKFSDASKKSFGGALNKGPHYEFNIGSVEIFEERLQKAQENFTETQSIPVKYETREDYTSWIFTFIFPILIFVGIWFFLFRRMGGGGGAGGAGGSNIFNVGKSKARIFDKDTNIKIDFKDVAGLEEAKVEIKEIVDFLKNPKKINRIRWQNS
jgi:ATP-dependent Zn protease